MTSYGSAPSYLDINIFDVVACQKNIISVSAYDVASLKIGSKSFSFVSEPLQWVLTNPTTSNTASIDVDFVDCILFEDLHFNFTSNTSPLYNCFYSLNGIDYEEFPFISYSIAGTIPSNDNIILSKYENSLVSMKTISGNRIYTIFDPILKTFIPFDSGEYTTFKSYLDAALSGNSAYVSVRYVFRYQDITNNSVSVYNNLKIKNLKLVLTHITFPITMNQFSVYAKIPFELKSNIIKFYNDNFFKPRYFEEYDFLPSITETFLDMLSYEQKDVGQSFSKYALNPLYKFDNLDYFLDIENTFTKKGFFNYQFAPVKESSYTNVAYEDLTLNFDIEEEFQLQFVKQYLYEYQNFFKCIKATQPKSTDIDYTSRLILFEQTKRSLYTHANIINTFVKGTLSGIETILGLFCKNLGYNFYYVEESPTPHNFIYRITTDLPRMYWENIIKDIVHPVSWNVEYVEIASSVPSLTNVWTEPRYQYESYAINFRDMFSRKYTELDYQYHHPSYTSANYRLPYGPSTRTIDESSIGNFETAKNFSNLPSGYTMQYQDSVDVSQESMLSVFSHTSSVINNIRTVDLEYKFTGLATRYVFIIFSSVELFRIDTTIPKFSFTIASSISNINITTELHNGDLVIIHMSEQYPLSIA